MGSFIESKPPFPYYLQEKALWFFLVLSDCFSEFLNRRPPSFLSETVFCELRGPLRVFATYRRHFMKKNKKMLAIILFEVFCFPNLNKNSHNGIFKTLYSVWTLNGIPNGAITGMFSRIYLLLSVVRVPLHQQQFEFISSFLVGAFLVERADYYSG